MWTWPGLWLRWINHKANTRQRMRTTGFWKLQSWPHVRVVSVIVLWMMRPLLISFHSYLLCCLFFSLSPPSAILIKHLCQCRFCGTLFILSCANLLLHLGGLRHTFPSCILTSPNQTTTLPKAPLTCFNSWPNFSWPAEEMWVVAGSPSLVSHVLGEHKSSVCWSADAQVRNVYISGCFTVDHFQEERCHKDSQERNKLAARNFHTCREGERKRKREREPATVIALVSNIDHV